MGDPKKLLFIHIPKTAGTATTKALEPVLNGRFVDLGHCTCNGVAYPWIERAYSETFTVTPETRANNCIFTVVRNPYDLLVSMYTFGIPYTAPKHREVFKITNFPFRSFRDFVHKLCALEEFPWYCPPQKHSLFFQLFDATGQAVPHFAVKQELLSEGLSTLCKQEFGIEIPEIPFERKTREKHGVSYQDFYDTELKELVAQRFGGDMQAFGYAFGTHDGNALIDCSGLSFSWQDKTYTNGLLQPIPDVADAPTGKLTDIDIHEENFLQDITKGYSSKEILNVIFKRAMSRFFTDKDELA